MIEIKEMLDELDKINIRSTHKENVVFKLEPIEFTNYLKTISVFDELNAALLKSTGLNLNTLALEYKNNTLLKSMGLDLNGDDLAHKKISSFEKKRKLKETGYFIVIVMAGKRFKESIKNKTNKNLERILTRFFCLMI